MCNGSDNEDEDVADHMCNGSDNEDEDVADHMCNGSEDNDSKMSLTTCATAVTMKTKVSQITLCHHDILSQQRTRARLQWPDRGQGDRPMLMCLAPYPCRLQSSDPG
jgi:hypothetical protein